MRHSHKFARKYVYTFSEGDASMREILGGKGIVADDRGFVMGDIEQATPFFSGQ